MQNIDSETLFDRISATLGADIPQLFTQLNSPKRCYVPIDAKGVPSGSVTVAEPTSVEQCRALITAALKASDRQIAVSEQWEAEQILRSVINALFAAEAGDEHLRGDFLEMAKHDLRLLRANYPGILPELLARVGVAEVA